MVDLNKIYDISEFGSSVYGVCYASNKIGRLKESILKIRYSRYPLK